MSSGNSSQRHAPAEWTTPKDARVLAWRRGPVAEIRLNRPQDGNVLDVAMLRELATAFDQLDADCRTRVIVLSGTGPSFCTGADVPELSGLMGRDDRGRAIRAALEQARRTCQAVACSRTVTVARLHGKVVGAGVALAAHCAFLPGTGPADRRHWPGRAHLRDHLL